MLGWQALYQTTISPAQSESSKNSEPWEVEAADGLKLCLVKQALPKPSEFLLLFGASSPFPQSLQLN